MQHVESSTGGGRLTTDDVVRARAAADAVAPVRPGDLVVVACNPVDALAVANVWPGARYLWRRGAHGAVDALVEVLTDENVAARFQRVVIHSGHGLFVEPATSLAHAGCGITVVAAEATCSHRLRMLADEVHLLTAAQLGSTHLAA